MDIIEKLEKFSNLLFSFQKDDDIEFFLTEIEKFLKDFSQIKTVFLLINNGNKSYFFDMGEKISESDFMEFSNIAGNFGLKFSGKYENFSFGKSESVLFLPIIKNGEVSGLCGVYLREKISDDDKKILSKLFIDICDIFFEKLSIESLKEKYGYVNYEYNKDLKTAFEIHSAILPDRSYEDEKLSLRVIYEPFKIIGGDYFNYFKLKSGNYIITLADAAGKGMPAALISNIFHTILKYYLNVNSPSFDEFYGELFSFNSFLCDSIDDFHFITSILFYVDFYSDKLYVVNFGNLAPLIFNSEKIFIAQRSNPPLGMGDMDYIDFNVFDITKGTRFLAFTDGIGESEKEYKKIVDLVNEYKFMSIDNILSLLYSNTYGNFVKDDVTLILGNLK